jgi:argininosuccinate lyase
MTKKLWGGRFKKEMDPLADKFSKSIQYDHKLAEYDLIGSMAHVEVLKKAKYLKPSEAAKLSKALKGLYADAKSGKYKFDPSSEDIHTDIQNALQKKVGDLVLKIHTARSRNEQVSFASKLYIKSKILLLVADIADLVASLEALGDDNKDVIIPGFTHMQHGQPVKLEDHLGAYIEMLARDCERLYQAGYRIKLELGAGALAGTPITSSCYNVDISKLVAGFKGCKVQAPFNSLDTVSDRDFVIETLSMLSMVAMHLSRLSEDLITWSTKEFDFIDIDEAYCTGSSLMPQKKNADSLELIRGSAGRIYGDLVSVLVTMKGLPLSYNRDMQLDKEPLFDAVETVSDEISLMTGIIRTLKFKKARIAEHLKDESLYATDLIYYLVGLGIPFRTAHALIGVLVRYSLDNAVKIKDMPEKLLKGMLSEKVSKKAILKRFDPVYSVMSKKSVKR